MFIVSKILQWFLWPLSITLILLIAAQVCFYLKKVRLARILSGSALLLLLFTSLPGFERLLLGSLEAEVPPKPLMEYPVADAIVVLGGTAAPLHPPRFEVFEAEGARIATAARLFHWGKADKILVSGGVLYQTVQGNVRTEALDMKEILSGFGIPDSAILMEDRSRNTFENAKFSVEALRAMGVHKILLVTEAYHLSRAVERFRAQGMESVIGVPCGHRIVSGPARWGGWAPDVRAMLGTQIAIKEYFGRLVYGVLGK